MATLKVWKTLWLQRLAYQVFEERRRTNKTTTDPIDRAARKRVDERTIELNDCSCHGQHTRVNRGCHVSYFCHSFEFNSWKRAGKLVVIQCSTNFCLKEVNSLCVWIIQNGVWERSLPTVRQILFNSKNVDRQGRLSRSKWDSMSNRADLSCLPSFLSDRLPLVLFLLPCTSLN